MSDLPTVELEIIEDKVLSSGYFSIGFSIDLHYGLEDLRFYPKEAYVKSPRHSKLIERLMPRLAAYPISSVRVSSRKLMVQSYPTIDLHEIIGEITAAARSLGFAVEYLDGV